MYSAGRFRTFITNTSLRLLTFLFITYAGTTSNPVCCSVMFMYALSVVFSALIISSLLTSSFNLRFSANRLLFSSLSLSISFENASFPPVSHSSYSTAVLALLFYLANFQAPRKDLYH